MLIYLRDLGSQESFVGLFLNVYRALLNVYRALLGGHRALWTYDGLNRECPAPPLAPPVKNKTYTQKKAQYTLKKALHIDTQLCYALKRALYVGGKEIVITLKRALKFQYTLKRALHMDTQSCYAL